LRDQPSLRFGSAGQFSPGGFGLANPVAVESA